MSIGQRIKQRRKELNLTQTQLGELLPNKVSAVAISGWEKEEFEPSRINLNETAKALKVSVAWLLGDSLESFNTQTRKWEKERKITPNQQFIDSPEKDLPLLSTKMEQGLLKMVDKREVYEYTYRPTNLNGVENAFAVYMQGNTMSPRYMEGEVLYCHPKPPKPNDYVVLKFKDNKAQVVQFLSKDEKNIYAQSLNPLDNITLKSENIAEISVIVATSI